MELLDSRGGRVAIERELFRGGEGSIHPVTGNAVVLAKLYLHPLDAAKQAKLAAMSSAATDALLRIAAWPTATLHKQRGGPAVGFLMPRFDGQRSELHELYRPGTRKQKFRQADWAFLMHAARNVAAAVATVHAAGHVVGDVNQRNFIAGSDATVKVLDCDSFQIHVAGQTFICPVGVPEFTPPELQGKPLDTLVRTSNHDAFGLAVLIFQILFMGRHPFAGRFLGKGEMPIERAIAEQRFAFGRGSASRQMEAPSGTMPFESLPPRLAPLFESAFAAASNRPTAAQWCDALQLAASEMRACTIEPMHKYHQALPQCPWCTLERASGVYFFIGASMARSDAFDLAKWWAAVAATGATRYEPPARPAITAVGSPAPAGVRRQRRLAFSGKIIATIVLFSFAWVWPGAGIIFVALTILADVLPLPGAGEKRRRMHLLRDAERLWEEAYRAAERDVSVDPLQRKFAELRRLKASYEAAEQERAADQQKLAKNARDVQLRHYLASQMIRTHAIPGVGPKRKTTLAAWNIHTASDVTPQALAAIQGFGPALQATMLAWRRSLEAAFVFDAKKAVPQHEQDAIDYRCRRKKADLEQQMRSGAAEMTRVASAIRQRRTTVGRDLEPSARAWAQASADLETLQRELSFRRGATT
jgi:DNA-binding helix-hairpin-helix protein with protein kinase domain